MNVPLDNKKANNFHNLERSTLASVCCNKRQTRRLFRVFVQSIQRHPAYMYHPYETFQTRWNLFEFTSPAGSVIHCPYELLNCAQVQKTFIIIVGLAGFQY